MLCLVIFYNIWGWVSYLVRFGLVRFARHAARSPMTFGFSRIRRPSAAKWDKVYKGNEAPVHWWWWWCGPVGHECALHLVSIPPEAPFPLLSGLNEA